MAKSKIELLEEAIRQKQGIFSPDGALIVETGRHTGRSVQERFIVDRRETHGAVSWSKSNQPLSQEYAAEFLRRMERRLEDRAHHRFEGSIGGYALELRSFSPWHVAFAHNMFRSRSESRLIPRRNERVVILHDPYGKLSELDIPAASPVKGDTLIVLDPVELRIALIGTAYAGEVKKGAFSLANYLLPEEGILPMHASANCLEDGTGTTVLFGLSGTGKTTLSASPDRWLIGDDEIVWTETGISNLEAGCYAKLIRLSAEKEPEIHRASNRFGAILENVEYDPVTREIDFDDESRTENTRGSYSLEDYGKVYPQNLPAEPPKNVVFLVADAFGAMPPVAKLDLWQAQYHFLSGYTSKLAGTEIGVKEPSATFSTCFGEPFMSRHPQVYARLLAQFAERNRTQVWLLNTGWARGGYGVGERFPLRFTRRILSAIQNGELERESMVRHGVFGFEMPERVPGVPGEWLEIPSEDRAIALALKFTKNMERFTAGVDPEVIRRGGPGDGTPALRPPQRSQWHL